jgi:hypothetical protein
MITAQELKGALAIMPTPAKPGAERLDATNTVDLEETARLAAATANPMRPTLFRRLGRC